MASESLRAHWKHFITINGPADCEKPESEERVPKVKTKTYEPAKNGSLPVFLSSLLLGVYSIPKGGGAVKYKRERTFPSPLHNMIAYSMKKKNLDLEPKQSV